MSHSGTPGAKGKEAARAGKLRNEGIYKESDKSETERKSGTRIAE
jgi:hypothetical protein